MGRVGELSAKMRAGTVTVQPLSSASGQGRAEQMRRQLLSEGKTSLQTVRPTADTTRPTATPTADSHAATAAAQAEGLPSARPSAASLENQLRQAQVDLDTDAIIRLNKQLKEERARNPSSGGYSLGQGLADIVKKGANQVAQAGADTLAFAEDIANAPFELFSGMELGSLRKSGEGIFNPLREKVKAEGTALAEKSAENVSKGGKAAAELDKYGTATVAAVPQAVIAMLTGGTSAAAQTAGGVARTAAAEMSPGVARTVQNAVAGLAKNPQFWSSFSQVVGSGYEQALEDGASVPKAALYAVGNGLMNAAVEVGGGIQTLPGELQAGASGWRALVDSALDEGKEEVIQGVIERAMQNLVYQKGNPLASLKDQDAVFNPWTSLEEFAGGAVVGGILSGGQMGLTNLAQYQTGKTLSQPSADSSLTKGAKETAQAAGQGPNTPAPESAVKAAQTAPRDVVMEAAARGGRLGPEVDMQKELERFLPTGKRLSLDSLSQTQQSAVEAANNRGEVDMDAENRVYRVNPEEHIDQRDIQSVGDKKIQAFQFDHPQIHPYYEQAARILSAELDRYVPGGETASGVSDDGNYYSYRTRRVATPRISELIDRYGVKPSEIGKAIEAIISDRGQENFSAAKRVEILLDDMLTNGYQDVLTGEAVPPNQDYIDLKRQIAGAVDKSPASGLLDGIDGLGAADAGSLNSDYDRLQAESSRFHPEGENAARPVDVPVQDFEGRNISKSASTIMGAQILNDADVSRLEQMTAEGAFSFDTIHDKNSIQRAEDTLRAIGFDRALERYRQNAQRGVASKDNTVLGAILMREAARGGNQNALAEIASLYARNSTNVAQAMQAQRILRQLDPSARLAALQSSVNELAEKYNVDIELDQELLSEFMNAESEETRKAAEAALIQSVASQLPTTFRAKYDAVRYLAMLGNPRTHARNMLGNFFFQIPATVKNRVGALGELGAQALGKDVERTKSLTGANPFGSLAKEARADWSNAKEFLEGGKYNEGKTSVKSIEQKVKPFQDSGAVGKTIGWAAEKNGALLEWEDNLFKKWIYSQSLAGYLKANGVKSISEANPDLLSRARNYAAQEALRNTFNDHNDFSDFVAKLGNLRNSESQTARAASYVTEGLLPFKRTPANVLARGVEYSPIGSVLDIANIVRDAKAGKLDQATFLKHLDRQAAALSGTALAYLGFLLSGSITGGKDEDKDQRNFNDLTGHQNYALELNNGTSVTLDWLAPSSIPFFAGVELAHAMQDGGLKWKDAWEIAKNMSEPLLEMSMLQGLNDVFENAAYAHQHGGNVPTAIAVSAATNYLTQVVPTVFGQAERTAEDKRMTTYTDENSPLSKDWQYTLGKLSQKVPGWDYQQIPYLDAWGREEETGDPLTRVFNNFFNPAYVSQVTVDQVERELQRVKDATGISSVFPDRAPRYFTVDKERKNLTAEEYQKYAQKRGQLSAETLKQVMDSPGYKNLSDEKKAEAISDVYQYADAMGKMEVSSYKPGDGTVAAGVLKSMLPPSSYILYRLNRDRDGDGKVTARESAETLMELPDLSDAQRGDAWGAMNKQTSPFKNPFTGTLAEAGMTPEESMTAWGIYGGSGTKEEPYTQRQKKQDMQKELDLTAAEVNRLWILMKKAAEGK